MNKVRADFVAYQIHLDTARAIRELRDEARALREAGLPDEAETTLHRLLCLDGRHATAWRELAEIHAAAGRAAEACAAVLRSIAHDPQNIAAHDLLGALLRACGRDDRVATLLSYADLTGTAHPRLSDAFRALAASPPGEEHAVRACIHSIRSIAGTSPGEGTSAPDAALAIAGALAALEDREGAESVVEDALAGAPEHPHLLRAHGFLLSKRGRAFEASRSLGLGAFHAGHHQKAVEQLEIACRYEAADAALFVRCAHCYDLLRRPEDALRCCREGLRRHPGTPELSYRLAKALHDCGSTREAREAASDARSASPHDHALRFQESLLFPMLCDSEEQSRDEVERYRDGLAHLLASTTLDTPEAVRDALHALTFHRPGFVCYADADILEIQALRGRLVRRIMAAGHGQWSQPLPARRRHPGERIRIGYVSASMGFRAGCFWLLGWLERHDRTRFEVFVYHMNPEDYPLTSTFLTFSDVFRRITGGYEEACRRIREDDLDILVWTDMDASAHTVMMGGLRLAPVQCAAWGYPYTSGMPEIDYYLSSDLMEPEGAQAHYTERLVPLPGIGVTYPAPALPGRAAGRRELGLPDGGVLFSCIQSVSKYHPRQDALFAAIARRVEGARIAFLAYPHGDVMQRFERRLQEAFSREGLDYRDVCCFVPYARDWRQYTQRTMEADVILDTLPWSGCITTLEALACGVPVVTLPGRFRRGRQTYGILRKMGVTQTIADDEAHYVEIASRLGTDAGWREALALQIRTGLAELFDNTESLTAVEEFYRRVAGG